MQCSIIVTCLRLYHVTSILHCHWREFWSRDTDVYFTYIRLGIIFTQFYINFLRQKHQIDDFLVSFNSQVSAYTPFHFSFTVPLTPEWLLYATKNPSWKSSMACWDNNRPTIGYPMRVYEQSVLV